MKRILFGLSFLPLVLIPSFLWADYQQAYKEGYRCYQQKDYQCAVEKFQEVLNESSEWSTGWWLLGHSRLQLGMVDEALENFDKSLDIQDNFPARYFKASALDRKGEYEVARQALETTPNEFISEDRNFGKYHYLLGRIYIKLQRYQQGKELLLQAMKVKDGVPSDLYVNLGDAEVALSNYEEGLKHYETFFELGGDNNYARFKIVEAVVKFDAKNKSALGNGLYQKALTYGAPLEDSKNYRHVHALATAYLGAQQYESASKAFRRVLEMKPEYCYARLNLGVALFWTAEYSESIETLTSASTCLPEEDSVYYHLGLNHEKLKTFDKALSAYEKANQLAGGNRYGKQIAGIQKKGDMVRYNALVESYNQKLQVYDQGRRAIQKQVKVQIVNKQDQLSAGKSLTYLLGAVLNQSQEDLTYVVLEARFFQENGKQVAKKERQLAGVKKGDERRFEWDNIEVGPYDKYELIVTEVGLAAPAPEKPEELKALEPVVHAPST